jgi:hypothetical protein
MEALILSCYAGGCAQRRCDPGEGERGCEADDALAADVMRQNGWEHREPEFRQRARTLVERHWSEIVAVAERLVKVLALDHVEVGLIADAAVGKAAFIFGDLEKDLAQYRAIHYQGPTVSAARQALHDADRRGKARGLSAEEIQREAEDDDSLYWADVHAFLDRWRWKKSNA